MVFNPDENMRLPKAVLKAVKIGKATVQNVFGKPMKGFVAAPTGDQYYIKGTLYENCRKDWWNALVPEFGLEPNYSSADEAFEALWIVYLPEIDPDGTMSDEEIAQAKQELRVEFDSIAFYYSTLYSPEEASVAMSESGEINKSLMAEFDWDENRKFTINLTGRTNLAFLLVNQGIESIDEARTPSSVTNMSYMFNGCRSLTSLDLSGFDTSSVTNMSYMFQWCSSLTSLDLSGFDTSSVTNMDVMFLACDLLTHIKCKQAFKDWCIANQSSIDLPTAMREGGGGIWEIVE